METPAPAIPLTMKEALHHLCNAAPIIMHRAHLSTVMKKVDTFCAFADLDVAMKGPDVVITPRRCELNELGKMLFVPNAPVSNGPEIGPHRQSNDRTP